MQPPPTSSLLGLNIFLSILLSNTLNLRSSLSVKDQVSHPYETSQQASVMSIEFWTDKTLAFL
jgi:hypothetical protein